jgi:hypothetical protein
MLASSPTQGTEMQSVDAPETRRTAEGSAPTAAVGQIEQAGAYLTDGVFLYRVVGLVTGVGAEMVELEDCFFLDVVVVPLADVRARRLRVVTPSRTHD